MDRLCDSREEGFARRFAEARSSWSKAAEQESSTLREFSEQKDHDCDQAQAEQTASFNTYVESSLDRFSDWSNGEKTELDAFISECEDAWQWILKSYCLQNGGYNHSDYNHYGHGCGYQYDGHHEDHVHHDVNDAIGEHDEVLQYGQDLDIEEIKDLDGRIQKSVDLALDGVAEEVTRLTTQVSDAQTSIHSGISK